MNALTFLVEFFPQNSFLRRLYQFALLLIWLDMSLLPFWLGILLQLYPTIIFILLLLSIQKMINVQWSTRPPTLVSDLLYNSCSANVCVRTWITNSHRGRGWVFCSILGRDWRHFQFNLIVVGGCLKSIGAVQGGEATRMFSVMKEVWE